MLLLFQLAFSAYSLRVQIRDKANETDGVNAIEKSENSWPSYSVWPLSALNNFDAEGGFSSCPFWNAGTNPDGSANALNNRCIQWPMAFLRKCCMYCSPESNSARFKDTFYGIDHCYVFSNTYGPASIKLFTDTTCTYPTKLKASVKFSGPVSSISGKLYDDLREGATVVKDKCYYVDLVHGDGVNHVSVSVAAQTATHMNYYVKCTCAGGTGATRGLVTCETYNAKDCASSDTYDTTEHQDPPVERLLADFWRGVWSTKTPAPTNSAALNTESGEESQLRCLPQPESPVSIPHGQTLQEFHVYSEGNGNKIKGTKSNFYGVKLKSDGACP